MPQRIFHRGSIRVSSLAALLVLVLSAPAYGIKPTPAADLSFFRFKITSEKDSSWEALEKSDAANTSQILGLFAGKEDPKMKLIAFRKSQDGGKLCASERSAMNIGKVPYEKIATPAGWDCVYSQADVSRITAIRSFYIRGKSRSTVFSLVLVGEAIPKDRFMKAVTTLKDVKR